MGICTTKAELAKRKEVIEGHKAIKGNKTINLTNIENKKNRVKECILQNSPTLEKIDSHLSNVSKSICKIKIETILGTIMGSGFLLKFNIDQKMFYCLVSNEHVIKNDIIKNNNIIIYIFYDNELKCANIKLPNNKRYIKSFIDIELDIMVVEILDDDNISKDYFLFPELESKINNKLINYWIYIPQYFKGKELMNARGIIKDIDKFEFTHLANTEKGSSGSPIFLENSIKVIGIHKEGKKQKIMVILFILQLI